MQIIHHRINTLDQLKDIQIKDGAEIDIRYHNNDLILHHDPFSHDVDSPLLLNIFLKNWKSKGPLILNVKSEGVEDACIKLMTAHKIENWFFLDLSMPFFVKYSLIAAEKSLFGFSSRNLAVRFSDFEPLEYAVSFKGKASWVWVDTFKSFALNNESYKKLIDAQFQLCLVSPELQGGSKEDILNMKAAIKNFSIAAVCTKFPKLWH
jgi:hypothetical protein